MDKIKVFFQAYEQRFNDAIQGRTEDMQAFAGAFADCFIQSAPAGVQCGKNDDSFIKAMTEGYDQYRKMGTKSMRVAGVDVTKIDDNHCMAKVHWDSSYDKDGKTIRIEFDVWYLLTTVSGEPKIFAYVTGDEEKVLRDHGLIPEK